MAAGTATEGQGIALSNRGSCDLNLCSNLPKGPNRTKTLRDSELLRRCVFYYAPHSEGCGFFAYSWKLPAYSGAFLLTVDNFSFFTYSWSFFAYSFSFFTYSWSFFAYSGKVLLIGALRDCKQRSSTVSKKAPTVSKNASPHIYYAV